MTHYPSLITFQLSAMSFQLAPPVPLETHKIIDVPEILKSKIIDVPEIRP
jgi:hypothetical protein